MARLLIVAASCLLVLAGCGDRRRPEARKASTKPLASPHAAISPHSPHGPVVDEQDREPLGPEVQLGNLRLTAPDGWIRKPRRSGFILAEFALPAEEAENADGRLTISIAAGGVQRNLGRWQLQFGGGAGQKAPEEIEIAGLKVVKVDFSGTYSGGDTMAAPPTEVRNQRMLGAIIPLGDQQGFIKCIGPAKTIAQHADRFDAFLRSLQPDEPKAADDTKETDKEEQPEDSEASP